MGEPSLDLVVNQDQIRNMYDFRLVGSGAPTIKRTHIYIYILSDRSAPCLHVLIVRCLLFLGELDLLLTVIGSEAKSTEGQIHLKTGGVKKRASLPQKVNPKFYRLQSAKTQDSI